MTTLGVIGSTIHSTVQHNFYNDANISKQSAFLTNKSKIIKSPIPSSWIVHAPPEDT